MQEIDALFDALGRVVEAPAAEAVRHLVREEPDDALVRINPLELAERRGLDEESVIAALLHATRLGILALHWNVLCRHCRGVLDANASLGSLKQGSYPCAFCAAETSLTLDETVENSFTVSPRIRRIAAHEPGTLSFWDYFRHVFLSSGVRIAEAERRDDLIARSLLEAVELAPGERMILSLELRPGELTLFDPVTHRAQFLDVQGDATSESQDLSVIFDGTRSLVTRAALRPGPVRLALDNRTEARVLAGLLVAGPDLDQLFARRPFLTAKRLLSNQTFRDIYRTDTLSLDQGLTILSLTFLFSDLKGSTALYERVGDLAAYEIVRAHFRIVQEIVAREGGAVVKTIGDAVMATFPTPDRAVASALRMREAMATVNQQRGAEEVMLKIGIHEGPCLAVTLNDRQDFFGQTVNIASRIQALAASDAILVSASVMKDADVLRLVAARNITARAEIQSLRGIAERMAIHELG